jgi:hypothetical protein
MPGARRLATVLVVALGMGLPCVQAGPAAVPLAAQVIRSYEALDRDAGERFYTTLAASLDASGGNVEYTEFEFSGATGFRGERHFVRLYPAIRFRRDDGITLEEERTVHLRHSYAFTERLRSFSFVQYQSDAALDLERRFLIGGGLRRRLVTLSDGGVDLGLGVMWEEERTTSDPATEALRGANLLVANGAAGAVDLNFTGFFQPRLADWADHRVAASGTVAVPLGSAWALTVSARWRRDSRPPADVERDDYGVVVGLRFSID